MARQVLNGVETMVPVNVPIGTLRDIDRKRGGDHGPREDAGPDIDIPAIAELDMWAEEIYELDPSIAASVGFPMWTATTTDKLRFMLFGTSRYKDVESGGHTYRYGIAVRVILDIIDTDSKASMNLPAIAAQVELNLAQANSQLLVSGYKGDIGSKLPTWQAFNVDAYSDYMTQVSNLRNDIFSDPDNSEPVLLSSTLAGDWVEADGKSAIRQGGWLHRIFG